MNTGLIILIVLVAVTLFFLIPKNKAGKKRQRTKQPAARQPKPVKGGIEAASTLLSRYKLEHCETDFLGPWHQGMHDGIRIAFQVDDNRMDIYAGDFDPNQEHLTDIYLAQVSGQDGWLPKNPEQRLGNYVDNDSDIDQRFYLLATGQSRYPQLEDADVRDALKNLSSAVSEVQIYEENLGAGILLDWTKATSESINSDLETAVRLYKLLQK